MAIYDFNRYMHWRDEQGRAARSLNRRNVQVLEDEEIKRQYSEGLRLYWTATRRMIPLEDALRFSADIEEEEYSRPVPIMPVWRAYPSLRGNELFANAFVVVQWLGTTPETAIAQLTGTQLAYCCGDGEEELRIYEQAIQKRMTKKKTDRA